MRKIALLLVIGAIALAGCIKMPGEERGRFVTAGTSGVIIKSFSPDMPTVEGGMDVTFTLLVKNVGERKAENVRAVIFGLSDEWKPQRMDVTSISPSTLNGADPALGFEGDDGILDFTTKAPAGKSVDTPYQATARVMYKYSTISENLIRLCTAEYLRSISPPGQPLPRDFGILQSRSSAGPLRVNVKTKLPVIPPGTKRVSVQFEVQNVGGGRTFGGKIPEEGTTGEIPSDQLDKVKIYYDTSTISCSGVKSGEEFKLVGGKSRVLVCDVNVGDVPAGGYIDKFINFTLEYNYFVE